MKTKMKFLIIAVCGLLCLFLTTSLAQLDAHKYVITSSTVAKLKVAATTNQIFVVSTKKYKNRQGTFYYFKKVNNTWIKIFSCTCQLGKDGMGEGKEGGKKTPIGIYHFQKLLGIASNPGTVMDYHQIDGNDYWCGGTYYNQFVDEDVTDHSACTKTKDEHLIHYKKCYQYIAAFDYNSSCIPGKGSAYFLHCNGSTGYTLGCIALPYARMKQVMRVIDSQTVLLVNRYDKIKDD